jgi:hypothetical protein
MRHGRLVVHGHFYQPFRLDPFTGTLPREPAAAPHPDWNTRIDAECYRPNVERGNVARMSFDLGPTLARWLGAHDAPTLQGFVAADRSTLPGSSGRPGNAMAQAFHHSILPLASLADRSTELRWGLRDFEVRFGRPATGIWFPETAIDLPTLRIAADLGIRYTILAPWQAADPGLDTRRPYRVELGDGRSIAVVFYDAELSGTVSFDPGATSDADRFARERVAARLDGHIRAGHGGHVDPLLVIATDGELYGHHQEFRDLFLQRLLEPGHPGRPFEVVQLAEVLTGPEAGRFPTVAISERTSWSCHHGVARWSAECPDAHDGRWKAPLRAAFERLAGGIDAAGVAELRRRGLPSDLLAARDGYVDVVLGVEEPEAFATRRLGAAASAADRAAFLRLLEAQRWRLAMFASDGWFWDDPIRVETRQVLRAAARAVRLVDEVTGAGLEDRLVADLSLLTSPSRGIDGSAIYRQALREVGQPAD